MRTYLLEAQLAIRAGHIRAHVLLQIRVLVIVDAHAPVTGLLREIEDDCEWMYNSRMPSKTRGSVKWDG